MQYVYGLDDQKLDFRQMQRVFLFSKRLRPGLETSQPAIQWILRALFWGGVVGVAGA